MKQFSRLGATAALVYLCLGVSSAAQNTDAAGWARKGQDAFTEGDFKRAAKAYEQAVKVDVENPVYLEGLGKSYEREAEQAAFPVFLTRKARINFLRALRIDPNNVAALQDLADLDQQPIGLCEGNLREASLLVDHLESLDPDAAAREQTQHNDAVLEGQRPGQRALCAPVKIVRAFSNPFLYPRRGLLLAAAPAPDALLSESATVESLEQGQ